MSKLILNCSSSTIQHQIQSKLTKRLLEIEKKKKLQQLAEHSNNNLYIMDLHHRRNFIKTQALYFISQLMPKCALARFWFVVNQECGCTKFITYNFNIFDPADIYRKKNICEKPLVVISEYEYLRKPVRYR